MRKRWLLAAGTMAGLVGMGLVVVAMLLPRPGVTKANFNRVERRMTIDEVTAIFGEPGIQEPWCMGGHGSTQRTVKWYHDDGAIAEIQFSNNGPMMRTSDGKVYQKNWHDSPETILHKIGRWLHFSPPRPRPLAPMPVIEWTPAMPPS